MRGRPRWFTIGCVTGIGLKDVRQIARENQAAEVHHKGMYYQAIESHSAFRKGINLIAVQCTNNKGGGIVHVRPGQMESRK